MSEGESCFLCNGTYPSYYVVTKPVQTRAGWRDKRVCLDCAIEPTVAESARYLEGREPPKKEDRPPATREIRQPNGYPPSPLHIFMERLRYYHQQELDALVQQEADRRARRGRKPLSRQELENRVIRRMAHYKRWS